MLCRNKDKQEKGARIRVKNIVGFSKWLSVGMMMAMLMQCGTLVPQAANRAGIATPGNISLEDRIPEKASPAQLSSRAVDPAIGDLWEDWAGDTDFSGQGTADLPYQIDSLSKLMGLSEAVAAGESYEDVYFELTQDIDLGGIEINNRNWNPIGWYQNEADMDEPLSGGFQGIFDGCGNTISGLQIIDLDQGLKNIGLFGLIDGGQVRHLNIEADDITGVDNVAVLAGTIRGDAVIHDVTVSGFLYAEQEDGCRGNAGGIAGLIDGGHGRVTVENCIADGIVICSENSEGYVGGIAGEVHQADLTDNKAYTQNGSSDRIQGRGIVGGIVGLMDETNLYNSYVDGTIGGNGTKAVGGIAGRYESGSLVVARFAGDISRTNNGIASREGTFIGTREGRDTFTYGTEKDDDLAYLFTNTVSKAKKVFGSQIDGDNSFTKDAHIGYWTDHETRYVTVAGTTEIRNQNRYFYEELEDGVHSIITRKLSNEFTAEGAAKDLRFRLDHFAPGYQGEPVAGYLLSVPRIDAKNANGTYDTDVAVLTALPNGNQSFYRTIDKNHAAAVAPGIAVTVATAPKNTELDRYQMVTDGSEPGGVKPPVYINEDGMAEPMNYIAGGVYSFIMPERDTEINVRYQKVTTRLQVTPQETEFLVTHIRTGDRKKPDTRTEVRTEEGVLIARYLNGVPDHAVKVQPISIHGEHNSYGDAVDRSMRWSVDDSDLLQLLSEEGYTQEDARIFPNLSGSFIQDILNRELQVQADSQYQEAIQPTVYEKSAVVTATTNPETSANHQPVYGNCRVTVTFQILDQTTKRVEGLELSQDDIVFTITRRLTGRRSHPQESITCSEPVVLAASLNPKQPFYKNVTWQDRGGGQILGLSVNGTHGENCSISVRYDASGITNPAWIQNVIYEDNEKWKKNPSLKRSGSAVYTEMITATSEDQTNGIISSSCNVTIYFKTVDETTQGHNTGGSSGGGSGGGGSTGVTPAGSRTGATAPSGSVTGTWIQTADGNWTFSSGGRTFSKEWAYIHNPYAELGKGQSPADWFRFDDGGHMMTGWYTDIDGNQYYLNPVSDNTKGRMITGWHWIPNTDGRLYCYYFNQRSDGTKGALWKNKVTPDGYQVDDQGRWIVDGVIQVR